MKCRNCKDEMTARDEATYRDQCEDCYSGDSQVVPKERRRITIIKGDYKAEFWGVVKGGRKR